LPTIIVLVKQVIQTAELRIDRSTKTLVTQGVPRVISESDKNAVEEAVRVKEKHGGKVVVVSMGPPEAKESLREALAMGADEAYLLTDANFEGSDSHATANVLAAAVQRIPNFDLVVSGDYSEDLYQFQVASRVAEMLNLPHATYCVKLSWEGGKVVAERDLADYREVVELPTPALLSVSREINEPRLPTLMAIMAASKKPFTIWTAAELALSSEELGHEGSLTETLRTTVATGERKRVKLQGDPAEAAGKLARALLEEGVVKVAAK
jgi:electron transfer flavoprotein beta subunit